MDIKWIKGLKGDEKERRKKEVLSYRTAFDDLKDILENLQEDVGTPDYESPSWAFKQADVNGYNRAIKSIIRLINIKDKDAKP